MGNSWTYPIQGDIKKFPEPEVDIPTETHYFTKTKGSYTVSGVLRSMALFIDGLGEYDSVEAVSVFPELGGWAGMVTVYYDRHVQATTEALAVA
jgi:hypothetical protein